MIVCSHCKTPNSDINDYCSRCSKMLPVYSKKKAFFTTISSMDRWKLLTVILAGFMLLTLSVWFYLTPYLAVWNMQAAAKARDAETFCSYIDFPVLRENLKAEINARFLLQGQEKLKDNPFAGLATAFAPNIINNMVDSYISPQAIELDFRRQIIKNEAFPGNVINRDFLSGGKTELSYHSVNDFRVIQTNPAGSQIQAIFRRHGLWDWKLSEIKIHEK